MDHEHPISALSEPWFEILQYARMAPSPHNIQSWRFEILSTWKLLLKYDPERLLPGTDPTGRFCTVGFGILCEFISIAAAPLGWDIEIEFLTKRLDPGHDRHGCPYAILTLVQRQSAEPLDRELIMRRRTSRLPYNDEPVPTALLLELQSIAGQFGHYLEYSSEPAQLDWVVRLNAATMFYDMSDPVARREVGGWIRFGEAEARRRKDGLSSVAMGFPAWLMKLFVNDNWLFNLPGIHELAIALYTRSMRGTRTVAWLSGPFDEHDHWFAAGRMMGRLWLTMTREGVYLHPFGSVITNPRAHQAMCEHFADAGRVDDIWLLVRLGKSETPPRAERLGLEKLIDKEDYIRDGI